MVSPNVQSHVAELETQLARIRQRNSSLLDIDMWDRWGRRHASDQEIAERAANEKQCTADRAEAIETLLALVARLRGDHPDAIAAWADAHQELLGAFIAEARDSTAVYVATQEREGWAAVKRGDKPFVDENTFYVSIDRERYRALFGIDP
jgi:hypothetical protein